MDLTLSPDAFRAWVKLCVENLRAARAEIDALNVFPVPDGDTGTNAYLTFVAGAEALDAAGKTADVLKTQVTGAFAGITAEAAAPIVIAYEPVWAIGTGKTATPEMAAEAHAIVRAEVAKLLGEDVAAKMRILYGGSVKPDNATALLGMDGIDGALVGGASLKADSFEKIVKY